MKNVLMLLGLTVGCVFGVNAADPVLPIPLAEVTGVAMNDKHHVAGTICQDCIFLAGEVVEQLLDSCQRFFHWVCLLRRN